MDLRLLNAFIRIAELGSFGRAAEVLNATQPTVSRQITALEQEVGSRLFTRHRRGVSLTQAGVLFRDHAVAALRSLDQAKAEITAQAHEPTGTVSLGLPPSLLKVLSGPVVDCFARRYPKVFSMRFSKHKENPRSASAAAFDIFSTFCIEPSNSQSSLNGVGWCLATKGV